MAQDLNLALHLRIKDDGTVAAVGKLNDSLARAGAEGKQAGERIASGFSRTRAGVQSISDSLRTLKNEIIAIIGINFAAAGIRDVFNTAARAQQYANALKAVRGSAEDAAESLAFLRAESDRLGLNLESATEQFIGLAAAAKDIPNGYALVKEVFTAVSEASTVLGLPQERLRLALAAIQQMLSKGVVSAEELRQQLGESLYGAFTTAARAIGKSGRELDEALRNGAVRSSAFLAAFARQLRQDYAGGVEDASQSARAALSRFDNSVRDLKLSFAAHGAMDGFTSALKEMGKALSDPKTVSAIRSFGEFTSTSLSFIVQHWREIAVAFGAMAGGYAGLKTAALVTKNPYAAVAGGVAGAVAGGVAADVAVSGVGEGYNPKTDLDSRIERLQRQIASLEVTARASGSLDLLERRKKDLAALLAQREKTKAAAAPGDYGPVIDDEAMPGGNAGKKDPLASFIEATTEQRRKAFDELAAETARRADLSAQQKEEIIAQLRQKYFAPEMGEYEALRQKMARDAEQEKADLDRRRKAAREKVREYADDLARGKDADEAWAAAQARLASLRQRLDAEVTIGIRSQTGAQIELRKETGRLGEELGRTLLPRLQQLAATAPDEATREKWRALIAEIGGMQATGADVGPWAGLKRGLAEYGRDIADTFTGVRDAVKRAFGAMEDFMVDFVRTGKLSFSGLVDSIIADLSRVVIQQSVTKPLAAGLESLLPSIGKLFAPSALGNVFAGPGIETHVNRIVRQPTVFAFANGVGLMGEAGAEAVMPLRRDSSGRLGVDAAGAGANVTVNVIESPGQGGQRQERTDGNGNRVLDLFVERIKASIAGDISQGRGPVPAALAGVYGLNRAAGGF